MLGKLKLLGLLGIGVIFIISSLAGIIGTWRINNQFNELKEMRTDIAVEGTTTTVMGELKRKVDSTNDQTKSSIERLDAIEAALVNKPDTITVVRTEVIKQVIEKDTVHETPQASNDDSLDTALMAINELWRDYCKRFPKDGSCIKRKNYPGDLQTNPTP